MNRLQRYVTDKLELLMEQYNKKTQVISCLQFPFLFDASKQMLQIYINELP